MDILKKMGWSREDLQYRINRVWHNIKFSACAVVCAVVGIVAFTKAQEFWTSQNLIATVVVGSLVVACVLGYAYSIMMINHHEEDEYDVYAY